MCKTLLYDELQLPSFLPGPAKGPGMLDQWTLEKVGEEEKAKSRLGLRCLEKKEASLVDSYHDYEMKREMEKMEFKTFCSVLGLEYVLAFFFFQETKDFKWVETTVVLTAVFLALVLMQCCRGLGGGRPQNENRKAHFYMVVLLKTLSVVGTKTPKWLKPKRNSAGSADWEIQEWMWLWDGSRRKRF